MHNFREFLSARRHTSTDATQSYEWRIDQLDRLERLLKKNAEAFYEALQEDFKAAPLSLRGRN